MVLTRSVIIGASMGPSNALGRATDVGLGIFGSHIKVGDIFGVNMFDDYVDERILARTVVDESRRLRMRATLDAARRNIGGGNRMYSAWQHALAYVDYANENIETWVVLYV